MPPWALPAATAVAAGGLSYLCCVRSMLRDRRQGRSRPTGAGTAKPDASLAGQLIRARARLHRLVTPSPPAPPGAGRGDTSLAGRDAMASTGRT